tara:strand:- start:4 stop:264 length:261 start_codon:yes stop_codon:yes gene_type:complete
LIKNLIEKKMNRIQKIAFNEFMRNRDQAISIRNLKKEVEELKKTVAKSKLDIDVKIGLYEKKEQSGRMYNKSIVKMLKQIKSKDEL